MAKKTDYVLFCSNCGFPQPIPDNIIQTYFVLGVAGIYCGNCENHTIIPEYIKKIKDDLLGGN